MLTKGAIGNLVNRYKAVLAKCNLINTFGSLAVASMLVLGGAGVAMADNPLLQSGDKEIPRGMVVQGEIPSNRVEEFQKGSVTLLGNYTLNGSFGWSGNASTSHNEEYLETYLNGYKFVIKNTEDADGAIYAGGSYDYNGGDFTISGRLPGVDIKSEAGRELGSLEIESNYNCFTGYGTIDVDSLKMNSASENTMISGVPSHDNTTTTDIYANTISIESNGVNAIQVYNQLTIGKKDKEVRKFDIEGDYDRAIRVASNSSATIYANELNISGAKESSKATGNGTLSITAKKGIINNDFEAGDKTKGIVKMTLGSGVTWTGSAITDTTCDSESDITLNGATWKITGTSKITSLTSDNGVLDITSAPAASAYAMRSAPESLLTIGGSVSGNVLVKMDVDGESTIDASAATTDGATFTAITDGNADSVTKAQASDMASRIIAADDSTAQITAQIDDGVVNAGYTTDADGNIISGGGASSVTKALLEAASVNTVALDKILTNDVRKRLGDIRSDKNQTGVWMRWDGGKLKGNGLTNDFNTIQIGGDTKVGKNCRLGVAGSFTHGDTEFDRGNGQLEGFSFAAYSTWMGENGMFADVVARLGHFSTEMNVEGRKGDMDNRVFSLSGEYGWPLSVCEQFFIEPQVELAYTYVNSEDLQLGDARFSFDSVDSLTGRLGLVAGWNLPNDMGNVYARASVLQQFMGDAKVTGYSGVEPTIHKTDGDDTWLEYGIGANIKLTDKTYIWADVERTEGADVEEEWRGTVGISYSF